MENKESIHELFSRYLAGNCTPQEIRRILDHFQHNGNDETLRERINEELQKEAAENTVHEQALNEVYDNLMSKITAPSTVRFNPMRFGNWSKMAAVWIVMLLAAAVGFFLIQTKFGGTNALALQEIATKRGERKMIRLNDGSTVWLNAASKLYYPETFSDTLREVVLEGEAFFEVAKQPTRPFVIKSGNVLTRVLGTSFNIKAYAEDHTIRVAVVTGKVQVSSDTNEPIQLTPDQQVTYNKQIKNLIREENVSANGILSWKNGRLQFRNTSFGEVAATLQRTYNVAISYDKQLENCPVHADFDENQSIDTILNMLLVSLNGKMTSHGATDYFLSGKGCTN